ncbi:MAG: capsular polysaccharide biosynthesis protein [Oscillospiraceae bacterium]|nr:capsular polysaccharide biosynthesis protein [Oscillospiraceae bacterium]
MLRDFHSHILPGIDDGSGSIAESLDMLRREGAQGISHVVATPHFYPRYDDPDHFLARRVEAAEALLRAMPEGERFPKLELGAEVYYFPGMSESEALSQLTIGGKQCILIEMPPPPWTEAMYRELERIYTRQNLLPVIAHVDRYISPLRSFGIPARLEDLPVLVQANAGFFLNRKTAAFALRLLRAGRIHVLGSDCHNLTDRPPNLGAAAEVILRHCGQETIARIRDHETDILSAR